MRFIALAALAVLLALPTQAQTTDPVERLSQVLGLTPDQADLVAAVCDDRDPAST